MTKATLVLAFLLLVPLVPAVSANDCRTIPERARFCQELTVDRPSGVPSVPQVAPYYGKYYLFIDAGTCASSPLGNACSGSPQGGPVGLSTPAGWFGAGVFSVLHQESNSVAGLQRTSITVGGNERAPDRTVLV